MPDSRADAHGQVPAGVQRPQPEGVLPVELWRVEEEDKRETSRGFEFDGMKPAPRFATHVLILHFYDFFAAVVETKVAV